MSKLTGVTPNLITDNIDRSTAFYRDVLGFAVTMTVPDQAPFVFVWLQRDGVNIFLNDAKTAKHEAPDATTFVVGQSGVAIFLNIEGVAELWNDVKDRARVVMALKEQWYGMTEFSITDPDGYLLTFAERKS